MRLEIQQIETSSHLSTGEKIEAIEERVDSLRLRAQDPNMPLESQHGALLIKAETALQRLKRGYAN